MKENRSGSDASEIVDSAPGRFTARNVPLRFLILYAYHLMDHELVDTPEWASDRAFDVVGLYPGERAPAVDDVRAMMQSLLAEQFHLKMKREEREMPGYVLVLARKDGRLGSGLRAPAADCVDGSVPQSPDAEKRPGCVLAATRRTLHGRGRSITDLTAVLQSMLGRPVVDRTGLAGRYDMEMRWAPTALKAGETTDSDGGDGPSLFTALEEQMGLKLVSRKERFAVYAVETLTVPEQD